MNGTIARSAGFGAASLLAGLLFAGPALADGLAGKGRTKAPEVSDGRPCTVSGNVGYTTDYVFRGVSQTFGNPAGQAAVDLTCGRFYVGVFGSNIDFGLEGTLELDIYGGYRFSTGRINWDVGFIYYSYPGMNSNIEADYLELKLGASGEIWKGGTLGGTVYYSPNYTFDDGETWTVEGSFAQALPKVGIFSPTFSALVGHIDFQEFDTGYSYWNAGLTLGFREKWSVDLRYWDTSGGVCNSYGLCDDRFVATLKYSF